MDYNFSDLRVARADYIYIENLQAQLIESGDYPVNKYDIKELGLTNALIKAIVKQYCKEKGISFENIEDRLFLNTIDSSLEDQDLRDEYEIAIANAFGTAANGIFL